MISNNNYGRVTTEWEDALVNHGILERKEEVQSEEEITTEDPYAGLEKDDIDILLEECGEQEEQILQKLKQERIKEMTAKLNIKFGSVHHISQTEYKEEVTIASKTDIVVVLLFDGSEDSQILNRFLDRASAEFGNVKFCAIPGKTAIANYPAKNIPTILVYDNEYPVSQLIRVVPGLKTNNYSEFANYLKVYASIKSLTKKDSEENE
eukprot:NODE_9_length_64580_cov_1.431941.p39 type:complete len:208 gc:universal NODE_9_length_64580_cov_1.431941:45115-45738(+)